MKRILSIVLILILSLSVLVACGGKEEPKVYDLENAKGQLVDLYPNLVPTKDIPVPSTITSFRVTKVLPCKDGDYTVSWSSNNDAVKVVDYVPTGDDDIYSAANSSTVKVAMGDTDVSYTLTATITAPDGKSSISATFELKVPKLDPNTHEELMATAKDQEVTVKGIVVAINSVELGNKYNHVFLADETVTGGYYCYKLDVDPNEVGVKVGMTVAVMGKVSEYSGMKEIINGQLVIVDETIKTVSPVDITEAFTAGTVPYGYAGLPVTITGVELGTQDLVAETSQYLYFSIGEEKSYVRTYVTDFPAGMLEATDKATIDADHANHFGWKADVTGILVFFGNEPYLIPMSTTPFTNYVNVTKTDAEKADIEKENLSITTTYIEDANVDLPTAGANYTNVAISWASNDSAITIANGKATIVAPSEKTVVTLTATLTCGDATVVKTFEVTLKKAVPVVTAPQTGVAYKFGMIQQNVDVTSIYYLTGAMDGHYMATTTDVASAIDVYLETADGGYYLYTYLDGVKTYINTVLSGTYVNGAYEASASTVYTWDAENNTLITSVTVPDKEPADYWFGTRNDRTYTTVGPVAVSYKGFYCQFYTAQ